MFRVLLAHPQEALQKRNLVYCVRIRSVVCGTVSVRAEQAGTSIRLCCDVPSQRNTSTDGRLPNHHISATKQSIA
jgi:hypothetical protein